MGQSAEWYFAAEERQYGPFPFAELITRIRNGFIGPETLVWTESLKHWTPAQSVADLGPHFLDRPSPAPSADIITAEPDTHSLPETVKPIITPNAVSQVRPWVRYFARITDITILSSAALSVMAFFGNELTTLQQAALNFLTGLVWTLMEALLLVSLGTTPAKWLFGIQLKTTTGGELTFSQAINRSLSVWIYGTAFFLPILSVITLVLSYYDLIQKGSTRWDRSGGFVVRHEEIGTFRIGLIVLLYLGLITVAFVSTLVGMMIRA